MENLNQDEQIKVATMCAKKGMNFEDLRKMGIDISTFPPETQATVQGLFASRKIDKSIKDTLYKNFER